MAGKRSVSSLPWLIVLVAFGTCFPRAGIPSALADGPVTREDCKTKSQSDFEGAAALQFTQQCTAYLIEDTQDKIAKLAPKKQAGSLTNAEENELSTLNKKLKKYQGWLDKAKRQEDKVTKKVRKIDRDEAAIQKIDAQLEQETDPDTRKTLEDEKKALNDRITHKSGRVTEITGHEFVSKGRKAVSTEPAQPKTESKTETPASPVPSPTPEQKTEVTEKNQTDDTQKSPDSTAQDARDKPECWTLSRTPKTVVAYFDTKSSKLEGARLAQFEKDAVRIAKQLRAEGNERIGKIVATGSVSRDEMPADSHPGSGRRSLERLSDARGNTALDEFFGTIQYGNDPWNGEDAVSRPLAPGVRATTRVSTQFGPKLGDFNSILETEIASGRGPQFGISQRVTSSGPPTWTSVADAVMKSDATPAARKSSEKNYERDRTETIRRLKACCGTDPAKAGFGAYQYAQVKVYGAKFNPESPSCKAALGAPASVSTQVQKKESTPKNTDANGNTNTIGSPIQKIYREEERVRSSSTGG